GGYTETEIQSIPFAEFIHPDDREMVLDFHRQRLQGKEPPQLYSFRIFNKAGQLKWMEINVVPIMWEGAPATLFFLNDITGRKQMELELELSHAELEARVQQRTAELTTVNEKLQQEIAERTRVEAALKDSHERLLTVLDSIDADIYVADIETYEILFMNKHIQETFGGNLVSKICWREFRNENGPCRICSNSLLLDAHNQPTGVYIWEGQNPITQQWYINHDRAIQWVDGRMVRLQVAIDITQQKQAESQIKASLKEKEVMLQEIHHRVKNNLQIISSLLNLQSAYVNDPQLADIFQDSQHRIRSMALIHEKLYRSKNLAQINFAEYIQDLSASMFSAQSSTAKGVTLECHVLPILLNIDQAVPSGLILNELLSNALKHAFPGGGPGKVTVDLTATNQQIHLAVSDNGIGLPPDFNFDQTDSLGLQLINTLVDQLDGSIEFNGQNGTRVEVRFPKHAEKHRNIL
ncbi:MAG: PAS domain S-box protein, partial [Chloroflexi bacterium]